MHKNVGDLGKLIVANGFKKLPKVQKIAQSGHTATNRQQMRDLHKSRPNESQLQSRVRGLVRAECTWLASSSVPLQAAARQFWDQNHITFSGVTSLGLLKF